MIVELPSELESLTIEEWAMKLVKVMPTGESFGLYQLMRDKLVKPYLPENTEEVGFKILIGYGTQPQGEGRFDKIENFLIDQDFIELTDKSNRQYKRSEAAKVAKNFETFKKYKIYREKQLTGEFIYNQLLVNKFIMVGAIASGIGAIICSIFAWLTYLDSHKMHSLDMPTPKKDTVFQTVIIQDTLYLTPPSLETVRHKNE